MVAPRRVPPDGPRLGVTLDARVLDVRARHPSPELVYDARLVRGLSEADRALGEPAGASRMLPNPHLLIRPFIRREAVLSSRIEGTITNLDQLFLFEADPEHLADPADAGEVRN